MQLGLLDHLHAVALNHLAFQRNGLGSFVGELLIHWLVVADYQVKLIVGSEQANRAPLSMHFLAQPLCLSPLAPWSR